MMIISTNLSIVHLICYVSWVLANIVTESSCCFRKWGRNLGCRFCMMVHPDSGQIIIYWSTFTVGSGCNHWVVMEARDCYLWWRWGSDTLWGTLIRQLWLHPCHTIFKLFLGRFLCNLLIYIYIYILNAFYSYFYCEKPIIYALMKATHHANIWYLLLALNPISTWNPSRCKVSLSINCVE